MNLFQFLLVLRARRKTFFLAFFFIVACALAISLLTPKTYTATAKVLLDYKGNDPIAGPNASTYIGPGYMATYMATQGDIIKSKKIAYRVIDELGYAKDPENIDAFMKATKGRGAIEDWLATALLKKLDVTPSRESSVLDINFKANNAEAASRVANAFANEYRKAAIEIKAEPLKNASTYFNDHLVLLRDKLEHAQNRLSSFQQAKGISNSDSRLDIETARLNELSSQLVALQGQMIETESRRRQAGGPNGDQAPEVLSSPLIQSLKSLLVQAEARLSLLAQRLGPTHPQYEAAKAEVDKLGAELRRNTNSVLAGVKENAGILSRREADLRASLEKQKAKVLAMKNPQDELNVLAKEVDAAQRAYDSTMQRFSQIKMEADANQANVAILSAAVVPFEPSSPKTLLNMLLATFVGVLSGAVLALILELFDRRLRSTEDLRLIIDSPMLGTIRYEKEEPIRLPSPRMPVLARLELH